MTTPKTVYDAFVRAADIAQEEAHKHEGACIRVQDENGPDSTYDWLRAKAAACRALEEKLRAEAEKHKVR